MISRKKIIIFIYNSFKDPLFQSNLFLYIKEASLSNKYEFVLITFEQSNYSLKLEAQKHEKSKLLQKHINWVPLKWHSGKFKLLKKLYDTFLAIGLIAKYRITGYKKIISLGTVAGSFAHIISTLLRLDHFLYQYEPHSEFLVDCNVWSRESLSYRILHWLEKEAGMKSKMLATGTGHMLARLKSWSSPAKTFLVPSCVDENLFQYRELERNSIRRQLKISDRPVLIYAGKFGGIYYYDEVFEVFEAWYKKEPSLFFLILTSNNHSEIADMFKSRNIDNSDYALFEVDYADVPGYISAADMGIVSVPPLPSQKFRSPIKVGEYLCCGIPYIVCEGVSQDDEHAENYGVGVVMKDFSEFEAVSKWSRVKVFLEDQSEELRKRCREAGITYRGFSHLNKVMQDAIESL